MKWEIEQLQVRRRELSAIIDAAHKTKSVSDYHSDLDPDMASRTPTPC